jgi:hypothetical protein
MAGHRHRGSHTGYYVVGQEITLPVSARHARGIDRILSRSRAFHGRVASAGQVQVEIGNARHQPWLEQFLAWWDRGLRAWLATAGQDDSLTFTCELGPQPYAIAGPDGRDLTDRWQDAQTMRALVAELWSKTSATAAA